MNFKKIIHIIVFILLVLNLFILNSDLKNFIKVGLLVFETILLFITFVNSKTYDGKLQPIRYSSLICMLFSVVSMLLIIVFSNNVDIDVSNMINIISVIEIILFVISISYNVYNYLKDGREYRQNNVETDIQNDTEYNNDIEYDDIINGKVVKIKNNKVVNNTINNVINKKLNKTKDEKKVGKIIIIMAYIFILTSIINIFIAIFNYSSKEIVLSSIMLFIMSFISGVVLLGFSQIIQILYEIRGNIKKEKINNDIEEKN